MAVAHRETPDRGPPLNQPATGPLPQLNQPTTLAESVLEVLHDRLLRGHFRPGERLVEAELARQLGISRGPVREALAQLKAEGLVEEEPRRGSFVADLSDLDIREIYELRGALETRAARLIIERGDDGALSRLGDVIAELQAAAESDDRAEFARLDAHFHDELCRLSANARLHRAFRQHARLLGHLLRLEVTTQYETLDGIAAEHQQLYEEIASRDVARAESACNLHLRQATERVLRMRS
jgi:GntR family transcriptional regulator of gluconate operon